VKIILEAAGANHVHSQSIFPSGLILKETPDKKAIILFMPYKYARGSYEGAENLILKGWLAIC